jgi:hypothetical protein
MVDNTSTNFPIDKMRFVDQENGFLTKEARTLLRALWNRTGGGTGADTKEAVALAEAAQTTATGALLNAQASLKIANNLADLANVAVARDNLVLGSVALGNTISGWVDPTGTGSRASIDANYSVTASAAYSQVQIQAINDQLVAVQKALAQLLLDAKSAKVISN